MVASASRNISDAETTKEQPFLILDETSKTFRIFNNTGRSLIIKFKLLGEGQESTAYLKECITSLTNYLVNVVADRVRIRNTENVQDKVVGISFRLRDQMKPN